MGTTGNDMINGTVAADKISASSGDDTINISLGNDYIDGSSGVDTYVINSNLENITIKDSFDYTANSGNIIKFDASYTEEDINIEITKDSSSMRYHLNITIVNSNKSIYVSTAFSMSAQIRLPISKIIFDNDSEINVEELFINEFGYDIAEGITNVLLDTTKFVKSKVGDHIIDGQNLSNHTVIEYRLGDGIKTIRNISWGSLRFVGMDISKIDYRNDTVNVGDLIISHDGVDIITLEDEINLFPMYMVDNGYNFQPSPMGNFLAFKKYDGTSNDDVMLVESSWSSVYGREGKDTTNIAADITGLNYFYKKGDGHDVLNINSNSHVYLMLHNNISMNNFSVRQDGSSLIIEMSLTDSITILNYTATANINVQSQNDGSWNPINDFLQ